MPAKLHFEYEQSKKYCELIGLHWLGEDWVRNFDDEAWMEGYSQQQVDMAMRHHLAQVKHLFTPKTYRWPQRFWLSWFFLTGTPQL